MFVLPFVFFYVRSRLVIETPLNPHFMRSAMSVLTESELAKLLGQIQTILEERGSLGAARDNSERNGDFLLKVCTLLECSSPNYCSTMNKSRMFFQGS